MCTFVTTRPLTIETTTDPNENLTMINTTTVAPVGADGSLPNNLHPRASE